MAYETPVETYPSGSTSITRDVPLSTQRSNSKAPLASDWTSSTRCHAPSYISSKRTVTLGMPAPVVRSKVRPWKQLHRGGASSSSQKVTVASPQGMSSKRTSL